MNITKNIITREEALKVCPDYVAFVEGNFSFGDHAVVDQILRSFDTIKKGDLGITYTDGQFVRVTVTVVDHDDYRAVDGPIVRVSNGEYSWRVDGDKYAWIEPKGSKACRKAVDVVLAKH